jgi:hypothetical protein
LIITMLSIERNIYRKEITSARFSGFGPISTKR